MTRQFFRSQRKEREAVKQFRYSSLHEATIYNSTTKQIVNIIVHQNAQLSSPGHFLASLSALSQGLMYFDNLIVFH